ncbi:MAG: Rne/Rng family ribonuclease [Proteobacteria bacterium]|nr:Rne/Rng family ribonuclease [Pseudomonadota bacterium]
MTESIMLINETDDECRIAVVENGILQEMLIEHTQAGQTKNNIYKGVVVQVQTSLQAAFVDYGDKKHGFLPNSELNPILFKGKKPKKNEPIQNKINVGDEVVVQVTREASNNKGAALSTYITLPGRFMVLMPYSDKGGVSKKIDDNEERDRLKSFLSGIEFEEHSVIIRTAGLGRSLSELKKDYTSLKKTWNEIWSTYEKMEKPGLILAESDVVTRTLRDYYTDEIKEVWVDNPETFQNALAFFKEVAPRKQKDLKLFVDDRSLFATYQIERQVEQLTSKQIKLKSGGSIVIDQTEALVAIDVNSGRSNQEGNIDSTALRTNLEASEEIARQLRLRNLGGLIVIDFIDMENESYRKQVEDKLSDAMRKDKAQLRFNPISQFGLLELSRQRLAVGISSTVESTCPVCHGKGKIPSVQASTNLIVRSIRELAAKGNVDKIEGDLPLELVNILLNDRRQSISDLELEFDIDIVLRGNPEMSVFNERQLKAVYSRKHRQRDSYQKKEQAKAEQPKKRSKKQTGKKDASAQKQKESLQDSKQKQEKPSVEEVQEKNIEAPETVDKVHKKQSKKKAGKAPSKEENQEDIGNFGIHPSCLFTDIKELEENELEEVTSSFENRLKGKIDNIPPTQIDDKYLWKSQNGNNEEESKDEELDEEVLEVAETETKPQKTKKKTGRPAKKKAEKAESAEVEEKKSTAKKKTTKPKSTAKKTTAKTTTKAKKKESEEDSKVDKKSTEKKSAKAKKTSEKTAAKKTKKSDDQKVEKKEVKTKKTTKKEDSEKKTTAKKTAKKKAEKSDGGEEKADAAKAGAKKKTAAKKTAKAAKKDTEEKPKSKTTTKKTSTAKSKKS